MARYNIDVVNKRCRCAGFILQSVFLTDVQCETIKIVLILRNYTLQYYTERMCYKWFSKNIRIVFESSL